ncbi:DUF2958 domain-containing protein [Dyadobacter psychrotolerans]|uniref:DUF2958 domain-containing protein n=1 Tax=Dyadobacter psychrotolerans TaxID=2541721 RepID=A0A4R5DYD7_9BACT|nr:DUF2958 domain-containing protein [Dyadobacter psychrotolerans]TDE17734.1 DUF2958 domain-containing protein [Dyadobacter psychrotolerans]
MYKYFTPEEEKALRDNGIRTDQGNEIDPNPVVKLFTTNGRAIWLLTELSPFYEGLAFGLCDLGFGEPELGNVYIPEIEAVKHATNGMPLVEKDLHFEATHPLSVYTGAARMFGEICEDKDSLEEAVRYMKKQKGSEPL